MFPELRVGMRPVHVCRQETEGGAVRFHRQEGTGREIGADPHDLVRTCPCLLQHRRDRYLQHTNPIARMLERPVVPERGAVGQRCVHDPVGILVYRARALFPRGQIHQHRPAGQGAEVHTKSVKGHITNPFAMALR